MPWYLHYFIEKEYLLELHCVLSSIYFAHEKECETNYEINLQCDNKNRSRCRKMIVRVQPHNFRYDDTYLNMECYTLIPWYIWNDNGALHMGSWIWSNVDQGSRSKEHFACTWPLSDLKLHAVMRPCCMTVPVDSVWDSVTCLIECGFTMCSLRAMWCSCETTLNVDRDPNPVNLVSVPM